MGNAYGDWGEQRCEDCVEIVAPILRSSHRQERILSETRGKLGQDLADANIPTRDQNHQNQRQRQHPEELSLSCSSQMFVRCLWSQPMHCHALCHNSDFLCYSCVHIKTGAANFHRGFFEKLCSLVANPSWVEVTLVTQCHTSKKLE